MLHQSQRDPFALAIGNSQLGWRRDDRSLREGMVEWGYSECTLPDNFIDVRGHLRFSVSESFPVKGHMYIYM